MKQRGQFEAESADFLLRFLPSRNGKYLCGQFAGKKINRHLQMMVTSAISMVLCCTMFLGTTMAWFTDSVITAGNRIIIGTLKVDLQYNGDSLNPEKNSSPPDVFATTPDVWVPGKFVVRKLTVVNEGDLPIGYELNLLPSNHTLAKYFDVYIPASNADLQNLSETPSDNWTRVDNLANLSSVYSGTLDAASEEHPLTEDVIIGLHMVNELGSTTVASELFGKDFTLHINLFAHQNTADNKAIEGLSEANKQAFMDAITEEQAAEDAAKKEAEEAALSYRLTKPSGSTTSKTGSETVSETTPETTPETVPETTPETTYETTPETVPETTSETTPETTSEAAGQNLDDADPDPVPPTTAETVPDDNGSGEDTQ